MYLVEIQQRFQSLQEIHAGAIYRQRLALSTDQPVHGDVRLQRALSLGQLIIE